MNEWRLRSRRVTYILLAASFLLIGPGITGFGPTVPLAGLLALLAGGLWGIRDRLDSLPIVVGYDFGWYARDSYLAAVVAVPVVLLRLGDPAAELQALGGLVGLAGMTNYFLRPLYLLIADLFLRLIRGS